MKIKVSKVLERFAQEFDRCWICRGHGDFRGLAIHHAARGCHRSGAREETCSLIRTCAKCHEDLDGALPISQLALIALSNPSCYNRVRFNELRGRSPDAISEADVVREISRLVGRRIIDGRYTMLRGR